MRSDIRIVQIAEEHIEGFGALYDRVARERRFMAHLEGFPLEQTQQFVRTMIERGYPQFVVLHERAVVGWCDVVPRVPPIYAHGGVLGIGLDHEFRGAGIGRALMQTAIDAAWRLGLTRIELTVRVHNTNAIALYRKLGFVDEGVHRRAVRIDGVYEDVLAMALIRDEPTTRGD